MTDKLQGFIDGMEHSADLLVNDMQRQFGTPMLRCVEMNRKTGYPPMPRLAGRF